MTDQTLTTAAPDAWWADLYDARHGDTLTAATSPAQAGDRLPDWRTGQTVDLDERPAGEDKRPAGESAGTDAADAADAYEEFDDDELAEDDESDDEPSRGRTARLHPRQVKAYILEHHGEQQLRFKKLLYNASAAGAGWGLSWEGRLHEVLVSCGRETSDPYAAMILGAAVVGATAILIDRRTRGWWWPLAWVCRIPLAAAVLALALYTPAATIR
jgi:hypothetical protein